MRDFFLAIFTEFSFLVSAPFLFPEMLWIVIPIVTLVFLLTFYFTEYANERYGWDNAFTNSIALFFVCIDSLRYMYQYQDVVSIESLMLYPYKILFIFIIMLEGLFIMYSSFKHKLPGFLRKFITTPLGIYTQMYILIVLVYTKTDPTLHTLVAMILLFFCMYVLLFQFSSYVRKKVMHVEDIDSQKI